MKKAKVTNEKALRMIRTFFPLVEKVYDADNAIVVNVTRADIAKSKEKDHKTCAFAVCCKRAFNADGVIIGLTTAYIIKDKTATRFKIGDSVSREITSFDRHAGFDEGEYMLSPACPSSRLGVPRTPSTAHGRTTGRGPRHFRHFTGKVRTTLANI
jgi:hypothetical protein